MTHLRPLSSSSTRRYRVDLAVLVAYLLLAIVLTYPLILNFATHVAGDGRDDPALTWNLWWVPYSILHLGASPIYTDYMFYPIGLNLAYYTSTYLNALLSIPIQYAFNLVSSANANLLLSFVLSGFGTYLLVKYLLRTAETRRGDPMWSPSTARPQTGRAQTGRPQTGRPQGIAPTDAPDTGRPQAGRPQAGRPRGIAPTNPPDPAHGARGEVALELAAFAAGVVYAFSANKLLYASLGQFNIASSHWIPFYVLFLVKLGRNPKSLQGAVWLGLFLVFQALSEFIFASFLVVLTAIYGLYLLLVHRGRLDRRLVLGFSLAALVFTVPMLPILVAMISDMVIEGDFIQQGLGFADVFATDLAGLFVPSHLHPLFGGLETQVFHFAYTNFAYLGFAALALALLAVWKVSPARLWGLLGLVFVLISLGPALTVNGTAIPAPFLPFNALLEIPLIKGNRYPSRWSVMVTLSLAVLAGYGLEWASKKLKFKSSKSETSGTSRILLFTFAFLFFTCFEHLSVPLPLSDMRVPDVYRTIAADKGDFTVLEVPLAWRNGYRMTGTLDAEMMFAQWYQATHRHPILGGNTSRNPEFKFQYFTRAPVISSLIAVETGHKLDDATLKRARELAPAVLGFFGVRYVVWHTPRDPQNGAALTAARAFIEQVLPVTQFHNATDDTGETVAYRVNTAPAAAASPIVRAGDPLAPLAFGEGWGAVDAGPVWATRSTARLFVSRTSDGAAALALRLAVPMPDQKLQVRVNGTLVSTSAVSQGSNEYRIPVPAGAWRAGMNEITLGFSALVPVAEVRQRDRTIGQTGITSPVSLVVQSAGSETGDFAHVFVNGVDAAPNTTGYNMVVIEPQTGAIETRAAFNTFASADESERLARFLSEIPDGRIVAVAVRDEASRYLTPSAVAALAAIGATQDLSGAAHWRWSHAIIGVKGAAHGTALEAASEIAPAQLVVGVGATEPRVAAAVEWFAVEP